MPREPSARGRAWDFQPALQRREGNEVSRRDHARTDNPLPIRLEDVQRHAMEPEVRGRRRHEATQNTARAGPPGSSGFAVGLDHHRLNPRLDNRIVIPQVCQPDLGMFPGWFQERFRRHRTPPSGHIGHGMGRIRNSTRKREYLTGFAPALNATRRPVRRRRDQGDGQSVTGGPHRRKRLRGSRGGSRSQRNVTPPVVAAAEVRPWLVFLDGLEAESRMSVCDSPVDSSRLDRALHGSRRRRHPPGGWPVQWAVGHRLDRPQRASSREETRTGLTEGIDAEPAPAPTARQGALALTPLHHAAVDCHHVPQPKLKN